MCFDDFRDAARAVRDAPLANESCSAEYSSHSEYVSVDSGSDLPVWYHDGQVNLTASFTGPTSDFAITDAYDAVLALAKSFGDIRSFAQNDTAAWPFLEFRVEYCRITTAKGMIARLTPQEPGLVGVCAILRHLGAARADSQVDMVSGRERCSQS